MEWLCPVCETINNNIFPKPYDLKRIQWLLNNKKCRLCYYGKNEINWEHCLIMNERIDNIFPRHYYEYSISFDLIKAIALPHPLIPPTNQNLMKKIYEYIRNRIQYRNYHIWRKWRYNINYRKAINCVLDKIDIRFNTQLERSLIFQYL